MLLGARQFFERRAAPTPPLPYDAAVEYLESTGTQCIDTGLSRGGESIFKCRFARNEIATSSTRLIFSGAAGGYVVGMGGVNSSGFFTWSPNSLTAKSTGVTADTQWHDVEMSTVAGDKYVDFGGTRAATDTSTAGNVGTLSVFLFARHTSTITYTSCRIASFSITDTATNQLLIDLIPVRFTNEQNQSEGAMYDRVSGQLFRNAGTGAFQIGPDKS